MCSTAGEKLELQEEELKLKLEVQVQVQVGVGVHQGMQRTPLVATVQVQCLRATAALLSLRMGRQRKGATQALPLHLPLKAARVAG